MSATNNDDDTAAFHPVDAATSDWLDTPAQDVQSAEHWSSRDRLRAADIQLIHSLLQQSLRTDAVAKERRILRVTARVRELASDVSPTAVPERRTRRQWWAPAAVAAAIVLVAVAFRASEPRQTALATVTASLQDAHVETDRHYRVQLEWAGPMAGARQVPADLWVRGDQRYVLKYQGPLGDFIIGTNGQEHWIVPAVGPVILGNKPGLLEQAVLGDQLSSPDLVITTILDRMTKSYVLTMLPEVDLKTAEGQLTVRCNHVTGQRQSAADALSPDRIELWSARNSGVAQRLQLQWMTPTGDRGLRMVTFELQNQDQPVTSDWFEHATHHASDRCVIQREAPTESTDHP